MFGFVQFNSIQSIRKPPESIDVGFEAKQKLQGVKSSTKELEFIKEAWEFLTYLLSYFSEKPLKYAIIRSAVCLNPLYLGNLAKRKFAKITWVSPSKSWSLSVEFLVSLQKLWRKSTLSSLMLRIKTCNRFLPLIHHKKELIPFFRQQWVFPSLAQTFGTFWKCFEQANNCLLKIWT